MTNEYLYGKGIEVPEIPKDVIDKRIELLNNHLEKQLDVSYQERDLKLVGQILKALRFWRNINSR